MNVEQTAVGAILSGTFISTLVNTLFYWRSQKIQSEFSKQFSVFQSNRAWREQCVSELLGPVYMQLDRTKRAFGRWNQKNLYLEAKVIREGNVAIRDLLLAKGHLIPPELLNHAGTLIQHYDRWLEEFERIRKAENPDLDTPFTFVGTQGFPFPVEAEREFRGRFLSMWTELYATTDKPLVKVRHWWNPKASLSGSRKSS